MKRLSIVFPLLSLLFIFGGPALAGADLCDDLAEGADAWALLSDTVDELAEQGGPTRRQAEELDEAIGELLGATQELGDVLVDEGNGDEVRMGRSLLRSCHALDRADTFDEIVDAMDDITDDLDEIVDYCDRQ